jgi:hypothetical protein
VRLDGYDGHRWIAPASDDARDLGVSRSTRRLLDALVS